MFEKGLLAGKRILVTGGGSGLGHGIWRVRQHEIIGAAILRAENGFHGYT